MPDLQRFLKISLLTALGLATVVSFSSHAAVVEGVGIEIRGEQLDPLDPKKIDPMEGINRDIYEFNMALDKAIIKPVAQTYETIVPQWGRERVGSFLSNLSEPVTFANSILQGDVENSFTSFWRFVLNTTIGIGGLFDQASYVGLERRPEGFDQTLGYYGVETGPYIIIPVLGPSTVRGIFGLAVDSVTSPFNYAGDPAVASRYVAEVVHSRADVLDLTDEIERTSFDPYATIRSGYFQHRKAQVENFNDR